MPIPRLQKPASLFKTTAVVKETFHEISLSDCTGNYVVLYF